MRCANRRRMLSLLRNTIVVLSLGLNSLSVASIADANVDRNLKVGEVSLYVSEDSRLLLQLNVPLD